MKSKVVYGISLATFSLQFSLVLFSSTYHAIEITQLPGFDGPLPSRTYSDYLSIPGGKRIHFWFIESENDPSTDPVVLWLQGGPGASGALGLFTEMGPYKTSDESFVNAEGVPKLRPNFYSWTKVANLIFVEAPAGVGFSYCPAGPCPIHNDTSAAHDNLAFLSAFFKKYETFRGRELFITGESYAGIYVPMVASLVVDRPKEFNLSGIAVGDGCMGKKAEGGCGIDEKYWVAKFMHGHGQFSTATYDALMNTCRDHLRNHTWKFLPACVDLVSTMDAEIGGLNVYNLYDECEGRHDLRQNFYGRRLEALNDYPCGQERGMNAWLNHPEVRRSLAVETNTPWKEDDGWDGFYKKTEMDVKPHYKKLIEKGVRILIYYGDTDTSVPWNGGEFWTSKFAEENGLATTQKWRPWTLDGHQRVAGHVIRYDRDFDFVTVRGAGHMVPEYKPRAGLALFALWMRNLELPTFSSSPSPNPSLLFDEGTQFQGWDPLTSEIHKAVRAERLRFVNALDDVFLKYRSGSKRLKSEDVEFALEIKRAVGRLLATTEDEDIYGSSVLGSFEPTSVALFV